MCLGCRTMGVAKGEKCSLNKLSEKDVLPDQHKLGMFLPALSIWYHPSIHLLHHTEDWNHQTCNTGEQHSMEIIQETMVNREELNYCLLKRESSDWADVLQMVIWLISIQFFKIFLQYINSIHCSISQSNVNSIILNCCHVLFTRKVFNSLENSNE